MLGTEHNLALHRDSGDPNIVESNVMDTAADLAVAENDDVFSQDNNDGDVDEDEEEEDFEAEFSQGGSSFCEDDDNVDEDYDDKIDNSIEDRPVSRFGYHLDPEVVLSDEGSETEQDCASAASLPSLPTSQVKPATSIPVSSGNINIPQVRLIDQLITSYNSCCAMYYYINSLSTNNEYTRLPYYFRCVQKPRILGFNFEWLFYFPTNI